MKKRIVVTLGALVLLSIWGALRLWPEPGQRPVPATPDAARVEAGRSPLFPAAPDTPRATERIRGAEPEPPPPEPVAPDERDEEVDAELCRLRGTLLDTETKLPLAGYRVELLAVFDRSVETRSAVTGEDGVFELELEPGERLILHRPEPGDGERSLPLELTPHRTEVVCGADGAPCERTFLARRPPGALEVEVTYADGSPAAGVRAALACTLEAQPVVDHEHRTDDAGRARLGVWNLYEFDDGRLTAWDDDGNVSEVVRVAAPFVPGLRRLVLAPGGELAVRVLDADGRPVAGGRVLLASDEPLGPRVYRPTDADGRVRFAGLFAGSYTLGVWLPEEDRYERMPVELLRGETRMLDVVLDAAPEPLAVSGTVLDEEQRPLAGVELAVALDGRRAGSVRTGDDGTFRFRAARCDRVRVDANVVQQGDRFEPVAVEVPFGTQHVVFRRTARAVTRRFEVEVYDRLSGAELEHFVATIDRGPGTEAWSDSYVPRRSFELRLLEDARWRVASHGYLVRELDLTAALDALAEGERLRVGLDPGLDHTFQVLDAETLEPLADVLFRSPTAGEARTDANGRVRLRADHWSVYRAVKEGYEPEAWDPDLYLLWAWGPLLLAPSS